MKQMIKLGSEGFGSWTKTRINGFFKVLYPNIKLVYENTNECDVIVRSHFFDRKCAIPNGGTYYAGKIEPIWNVQERPYIYWSGESWPVLESEYHTKYVHIKSTNEDENAVYLPYMLNSPYLTEGVKVYTNEDRNHLLAYCNSHPLDIREDVFNRFVETSGENMCHSLGACHGKYKDTHRKVSGVWSSKELIRKYSDYYFVIAMENKVAPGYITEKILNAYAAGSIPIYWGAPVVNEFFNKDSFVNVSDFKSIDECVDYVVNMELEKIHWMREQPIFKENSIYDDIININKNNDYYEKNAVKLVPLLEEWLV